MKMPFYPAKPPFRPGFVEMCIIFEMMEMRMENTKKARGETRDLSVSNGELFRHHTIRGTTGKDLRMRCHNILMTTQIIHVQNNSSIGFDGLV